MRKRLGWILPAKLKVHKQFTFKNGRVTAHSEPFAKRRAGKLRRVERKFVLQQENLI